MNTFHIFQLEELIMLSYQYYQKRKTDLVEKKNLRFYFVEIKKTQPKVFVEFTPIYQDNFEEEDKMGWSHKFIYLFIFIF